MLFSIAPKTAADELFNREKELKNLETAVDKDRIVVLDGLRRIGKTSLLKVFLHESDHFGIFVDCRKFVRGVTINTDEFDASIVKAIKEKIKTGAFKKMIDSVASVDMKFVKFDFEKKEGKKNLGVLLKEIDEILENGKKKFILAFDEAQYLRFYGRGGKDFLYLMAYAFDNLKNIVFVLTGSEVGLLFDFLKLNNPDEPLYARYVTEIGLGRFSREKSLEYLKVGLEEIGIESTPADRIEIVEELDGIVGYLSIFGYEVYRNGPDFKSALEKAGQMAQGLIKKEIEAITERSPNYGYVLNAISMKMDRYSTIKKFVEATHGKIHDSTLSNVINSLVKQNFVEITYEKTSKKYSIPDPIVQKFCSSMSL